MNPQFKTAWQIPVYHSHKDYNKIHRENNHSIFVYKRIPKNGFF
jgi:hypothetical protein